MLFFPLWSKVPDVSLTHQSFFVMLIFKRWIWLLKCYIFLLASTFITSTNVNWQGLAEQHGSLETRGGVTCFGMKPSPQVCQAKTINGRGFPSSYKWQHTVQLGSGETEQEHIHASTFSRDSMVCLPTASMQFFDFLGCTNGGMNMRIHPDDSENVFSCEGIGCMGSLC